MGDPKAKVPNLLIVAEYLALSSSLISVMTSYLPILVLTLAFGRLPQPMSLGFVAD
jgi:hypothetical protein